MRSVCDYGILFVFNVWEDFSFWLIVFSIRGLILCREGGRNRVFEIFFLGFLVNIYEV